jgi:glycosyltransferase involved in cell wall biosynthesis
MTIRVLATADYFEPGFRAGGPVRSLALLVDTAPPGVDLALITRDRDVNAAEPYPGLSGSWIRRGRADIFYLPVRDRTAWVSLWRRLRGTTFDVLYVNSLWSPVFTVLPVLARTVGLLRTTQVIVAPRGELSPGAMAQKSWKKRPFAVAWGRLLKSSGAAWHASTEAEAAEIRTVYPWAATVHVTADQIPLPADPLAPVVSGRQPRFIHVGRIVPQKNLLMVLEAFSAVPGAAQLDIFGPVEDVDYWRRCLRLIESANLDGRVHYRGELGPSEVRETFRSYDAFLLPTRGENFCHAIAESLSASCPVICSDRTPWTAVLAAGGGAVLPELTTERLRAEIERLMAQTPAERLSARLSAGAAYRVWHSHRTNENFLTVLIR